ncbi:MAG: hypothetical protein HFI69_08895 [Lachnospiraceae bacterium]|nr:hypothetical protein [Lachnospiraceae bacterium]
MNVSLTNIGTDKYRNGSVFAGGLPMLQNNGLKSAQEKAERQQKAQGEVAFWEKQKENLKEKECDTVEEIAEKLKALHSYEEEIASVKKSFNNEQMWHIMDEAQERGEKIAEAAEKMEPKTPEERQEEAAEEALGTEEDKSAMEEMLDDVSEMAEENAEMAEDLQNLKETAEELEDNAQEAEHLQESEGALSELTRQTQEIQEQKQQELEEEKLAARQAQKLGAYQPDEKKYLYQGMDVRI